LGGKIIEVTKKWVVATREEKEFHKGVVLRIGIMF